MNTETINILLIEGNPIDARLIQEFLKSDSHTGKSYEIYWMTSLLEGLEKLRSTKIDVVLADMGLPDSQGIATLEKLVTANSMVPIIVVTGLNDNIAGVTSVQAGAQDFLVKGQIDEQLMIRTINHAIERKERINQKLLTNRILSILNRHNDWQKLLCDILSEIKEYTKMEAIGIRLKMGNDYPYFEYNGFSENFIQSENHLCAQNEFGELILDDHGEPLLECMCGNVIQGRTDPALPFFTTNGSFWTNSTSKLLAETSEADRQARTRNRCHGEGYESVALIPLRSGEEVIGLLQLNDKMPNRFTLTMILFFEEIGSTLGIAFSRMEAERKNQERIKELNVLHNIAIIAEISSSIEEYALGILELIPMGFRDQEHTCCLLEIEDKSYQTKNCHGDIYLYGSDILYNGLKVGRLDVGISENANLYVSRVFLQEEKELIITIAKQIGDFIGRDRSDKIQKIIYNISSYTNTASNLEELVMFIQKQLLALIDTTNFYIALYDAKTDMISTPYFADQKDTIDVFPAGKTLTAYVIRTKKPLLGRRDDLDQLEASGEIKTIGEKAKVWMGIPLKVKGNVIGVFAVQSYTDENAYSPSDLEILEVISQQISISIERKKAEQELVIALEKAQESDRLKSAFLTTMSHELRTPLNAVIGFSQLINGETPMDDILEFVKHINKGGHHLLEIIEDILNVSVIESGLLEVNMGDFSLVSLLNEIEILIRTEQAKIQKQHIRIVSIPPEFGNDMGINTDSVKLKQILMNLLKNAMKFTHEGSIEYGVQKLMEEDQPVLRFYVRDTGIGIPVEVQKIVFDLFRQADETHTRTHGGTGVGLSVSKKLVELLGGSIWVESETGKGSIFYFTIPFEGQKLPDEILQPGSMHEQETYISEKNVLIAEDEESNYELLDILLSEKGFNLIWAKNGQEAVQLCAEHPDLDLILMDLKMPVMNGYEATRLIREANPILPIIAQTAYAMPADRDAAIDAGCNELLTKPIRKEELFKTIERCLR